MKKFFCIIPMQPPVSLHYEPEGNSRLDYAGETEYPILCAISGYAQEGEIIRVIGVATRHPVTQQNIDLLEKELNALCEERSFQCPNGLEIVWREEDDRVAAHAELFNQLLDFVDDEDELFGCMTFGTKPTSIALTLALQYAYRIKDNATIRCIVYGQVSRPSMIDRSTWTGKVYDMTALIQLDELVHTLAQSRVENPRMAIDLVLSL